MVKKASKMVGKRGTTGKHEDEFIIIGGRPVPSNRHERRREKAKQKARGAVVPSPVEEIRS